MISVLIVGNGNVASHLYDAFLTTKKSVVSKINSRTLDEVPLADITILAVADGAIPSVSAKIKNSFVVHTAGNVDLYTLENTTRKGVFYPLQTFTKEKSVDFNDVPFCLEAEHETDLKLLEKLALTIGTKIFYVNSEQRKNLHLAAVFVNNFTNHMYKIGSEICGSANIPFEILKPLIKETADKIVTLSPEKAQTGPAIRQDETTIKNHLKKLNKNQQEIYKLLTKSIQNGEKL